MRDSRSNMKRFPRNIIKIDADRCIDVSILTQYDNARFFPYSSFSHRILRHGTSNTHREREREKEVNVHAYKAVFISQDINILVAY